MARWTLLYVLGYLPQTFLLLYATLGLVGARAPARRLAIPAALLGLVSLLFRPYLLPAWYAPVYLLVLTMGILLFRLGSLLEALAAAAVGLILIAAGDLLVTAPVLYGLGLSYPQTLESWWSFVLLGTLEGTFVVIMALLVWRRSFTVVSIAQWEKDLARRRERK